MADDYYKVISEVKNESRILQQKILTLESKINDFQSRHDALNKITDLESKINRIESILMDMNAHDKSSFATILQYVERIRSDIQIVIDHTPKPEQPQNTNRF